MKKRGESLETVGEKEELRIVGNGSGTYKKVDRFQVGRNITGHQH